jgi:hypothetical protein
MSYPEWHNLPEIDGYENWWLLGQVATLREVINWPVN